MTSLIQRIYDFAAEEVTADVNNSKTTTEDLEGDWDHLVTTPDDLNASLTTDLADGETVQLTAGTHTLNKTAIDAADLTNNDITIRGEGPGVTIIKLEDSPNTDGTKPNDDCMLALSGDGITIRDLTLDGNKSAYTPASDSDRVTGFKENGGDNYQIINVESKNHTYKGLGSDPDATLGTKGLVKDCEFHAHHADGIHPGNDRVRILDNLVYDGEAQDAIEPTGDYCSVKGNIIWDHPGSMVDVFGGSHCVVEGNIGVMSTSKGPKNIAQFSAEDGSGTIVKGNVASNNLFVGSRVTGVTSGAESLFNAGDANQEGGRVEANVTVGQHGTCDLGDGQLLDFVNNSIIDTNNAGITIRDNAPANGSETAWGLTVAGNKITNGGINGDAGATQVVIRNNKILGAPQRALRITGDEWKVIDNTIDAGGNDGIVDIDGHSHVHVIDNTIRNFNEGIRLLNMDEVVVRENDTFDTGGTSWGIEILENDGAAHSGFIVKDNWGLGMRFASDTGSLDDLTLRDNRVLTSPATNSFEWSISPTTYIIENQTGWTAAAGGETTVDNGGTIAHGLSEAPDRYYVESKDSGEYAHVTGVDATNLTVEVLTVSDGSGGGTGNSVVWEAKTPGAV